MSQSYSHGPHLMQRHYSFSVVQKPSWDREPCRWQDGAAKGEAVRRGGGHLDLRHDGPPLRAGAGEGGERRRRHHGTGPGEAAQVTARDVVLLVPHDDGIHDKEASPWQPESVLLGDEWSALKVQGYGNAPVGHQVKAGNERRAACEDGCWYANKTHTFKNKHSENLN